MEKVVPIFVFPVYALCKLDIYRGLLEKQNPMDDLLRAIATQKPLPTQTQAPPASERDKCLHDLVLLQEQVLFAFRMVLENNLPLPPDVRLQLFQMHDNVCGIARKLK
jgi:hypothetical protein